MLSLFSCSPVSYVPAGNQKWPSRATHLSPWRNPASQGCSMQTTHMPSSSSKSVCGAVSGCLPLCLEGDASARMGADGTAGAEGAAGCWAGVAALPSPAVAAAIAGGLGALGSVANQPERNHSTCVTYLQAALPQSRLGMSHKTESTVGVTLKGHVSCVKPLWAPLKAPASACL